MNRYYNIFPYDKVNKGEDVIIYGMGNVGKQYVEQIKKLEYCNLLFAVDKNWGKKQYLDVQICEPEEIKKYPNTKIVIAQYIKEIAETIYKMLINWGIPEENIIFSTQTGSAERDVTEMQHFKEIWECLRIKKVKGKKLIRLGRRNDGGYIMLDDMEKGDRIAYSFGICDDVSWDKDMAGYGYDVYMYDHTINQLPEQNVKFHFFKEGIADKSDFEDTPLNTLEHYIDRNKHAAYKNMILKMDVEGAEWGFLDMVDETTLNQFDQILFELHFLTDTNRTEEFVRLLKKIGKTHQVVHVHPNNICMVSSINGYQFSSAMEVVFAKKASYEWDEDSTVILPIDLDAPCSEKRAEINLGKWNEYKWPI